jgi:Ferredoxin-dependent bilin reductase
MLLTRQQRQQQQHRGNTDDCRGRRPRCGFGDQHPCPPCGLHRRRCRDDHVYVHHPSNSLSSSQHQQPHPPLPAATTIAPAPTGRNIYLVEVKTAEGETNPKTTTHPSTTTRPNGAAAAATSAVVSFRSKHSFCCHSRHFHHHYRCRTRRTRRKMASFIMLMTLMCGARFAIVGGYIPSCSLSPPLSSSSSIRSTPLTRISGQSQQHQKISSWTTHQFRDGRRLPFHLMGHASKTTMRNRIILYLYKDDDAKEGSHAQQLNSNSTSVTTSKQSKSTRTASFQKQDQQSTTTTITTTTKKLFGKFADHIYDRLVKTNMLVPHELPLEFQQNEAIVPQRLYKSNVGEERREQLNRQKQQTQRQQLYSMLALNNSTTSSTTSNSTTATTTTATNILTRRQNGLETARPNGSSKSSSTFFVAQNNSNTAVKITVKALKGSASTSPLRYARIVLFETIPAGSTSSSSSATAPYDYQSQNDDVGLQTLNVVVYPSYNSSISTRTSIAGTTTSATTALPIWGVSLVASSNKFKMPCMATIDAQPGEFAGGAIGTIGKEKTTTKNDGEKSNLYVKEWEDWYTRHVDHNPNVPWGGKLRSTVTKFVSNSYPLLWTRFQNSSSKDDAVHVLQTEVFDALIDHLEIYLGLASESHIDADDDDTSRHENNSDDEVSNTSDHQQKQRIRRIDYQNAYMDFWRYNEPERTTLRSLYGDEWSERLLWEVLFPPIDTVREVPQK